MPANSTVTRSRRLLILGGYAALGVAFLLGGVIPYLSGVSSAQAAIGRNQREIEQRQATKNTLEKVTQEIADITFQVRNYPRLVPENQDLGSFLQKLSEELSAAGMKDVDVRNQASISLGKSQKLPIPLKASGTFPQFQQFLVKLEHFERMCSLGRLTVEADTEMTGKVNVDLTLFIYSSKPN